MPQWKDCIKVIDKMGDFEKQLYHYLVMLDWYKEDEIFWLELTFD
jgi:hypothetical protein